MTEPDEKRRHEFRKAIEDFIRERRDAKLKGESIPEQEAKYDYATWLADTARRANQIRVVTHVLKGIHPDARGNNIYTPPNNLPDREEVGSHLLGSNAIEDATGNSGALDVYKFLKIKVYGRRLLDWLMNDDADLKAALSPDPIIAKSLVNAFKVVMSPPEKLATHTLAKQLYWCISHDPCDEQGYHLVQPLFPSSLVQEIHQEIQNSRFGETSLVAAQMFRSKSPSTLIFSEYRNLVVRKLGSTKPQIVSQLNSERHGMNYLLASLPPRWTSERKIRVLDCDSVLKDFTYWDCNRTLIKELITFLKTDPPPNDSTRIKRRGYEQVLADALAAYGVEIRSQYEPGWTALQNCKLPECEQLWLDPERSDEAFQARLTFGDWPDEIATRFALWLNNHLRKAGLRVGDSEAKHWARQAVIEAAWPIPLQRRFKEENVDE